jgi:tetratricopeptide (TPR) repeat protein
LAVFERNGEERTLVARLTLMADGEVGEHVRIEGQSEESVAKVREIVERFSSEEKARPVSQDHGTETSTRKWVGLSEALKAEGFGIEDISSGDYQINIEIDLQSGFLVGAQDGLHTFAPPNNPLARNIAAAVADAMRKIPDDLAQSIKQAVASNDTNSILAAIRKGRDSGAFGMRPTRELLDSLFSFDIAAFQDTDRRLVRECRLTAAHLLHRWDFAGAEAEAMLHEEADRLDDRQKADLRMVVATAEMTKGHRETALHIWRKLLESPDVLGPGNRGWAWRNIALASPPDSSDAGHAARCSADAFLEAGNKEEASASLMVLAKNALYEEPNRALEIIDEIVALIERQGLRNRELRAATFHARSNRLAQLGRHREAAADAEAAINLRRGLIGAEETLISSLYLAGIENGFVGNAEAAKRFKQEADKLTEEVRSPHFLLAHKVQELAQNFDSGRAAELLRKAEQQGNLEIIAGVRVIQATRDTELSDTARLSLLEDILQQLENGHTPNGVKRLVQVVLAGELSRIGESERAEAWLRKVLATNPFDAIARDALIKSLWQRERWGDAAIVLKRQVDLRGALPGILYAYGRSLFEAGDSSGAVSALTQALDLAGDNADLGKLASELRERALRRGGTISPATPDRWFPTAVTRDEFDAALELFSRFVSADKRMGFWKKSGNKHSWATRPEKRAQDLLHTFLKARFLERVSLFEELDTGAGRLDIFMQFHGGLRLILELKMCGRRYSSEYAAAGETQLVHYMKNRDSKLGYLIVFDARSTDFGKLPLSGENSLTIFTKIVDVRPSVGAR